ncbi:MAG TPA: hypothetical protein VGE41_09315 [Verrucomicrobiae bacterium]|jgi:TolB protein
MNYKPILAALLLISGSLAYAADVPIVIDRKYDPSGFMEPIPVNISGFTPEAANILRWDLTFMAFTNVPAGQAKFLIKGSNGSRVEGRLIEQFNQHEIFARAYTGASERSQIHALADDIARTLIKGVPTIAQSKIAFKVEIGRGNSEVYISDYDGFNPIQVTRDNTIVSAPCWAGHGSLFYSTYKLGNPRIFSQNLGTGTRKPITPYNGANISPAVSPDGSKLAMILSKSGSPNLYVSDLNGGNLKQLTFSHDGESCPCWSPDNQTICFVSRERGPASLFTISAHGGRPRLLSTAGAPTPTEPDWSPDGKWIAFTSQQREFKLYIIPSAGGSIIDLQTAGEDAVWAPNSRAVIFSKGPDHAKTLSLLDVPTKQVKTIARILESNSQPSWAK